MAKKKQFFDDMPSKMCPQCGELSVEQAEVCDNCGYSFVDGDTNRKEVPASPEEKQKVDDLFGELGLTEDHVIDEPAVDISTNHSVETMPTESVQPPLNMPEELLLMPETPVDEVLPEEPIEQAEDVPEEPAETPIDDFLESNLGSQEEPETTTEEVPSDEDEEAAETPNVCPNCGHDVDEDAVFCNNCGTQLREAEDEGTKALLQTIDYSYSVIPREDIDFSKAIPGEIEVVRKKGDKYEAIMAPDAIPLRVLDVDEKEAEMLKADFMLKQTEELSVKDVVEAGFVLSNSGEYLKKYYGESDVNSIYGEGLSDYASVYGANDELLDLGLDIEIMQILNTLSGEEQSRLAKTLKSYDITEISPTTARCIAEGDRKEESMRDLVVRDKMMRDMIDDIVAPYFDR